MVPHSDTHHDTHVTPRVVFVESLRQYLLLSSLPSHPNVCGILGVCSKDSDKESFLLLVCLLVCLILLGFLEVGSSSQVCPYMAGGSLRSLIDSPEGRVWLHSGKLINSHARTLFSFSVFCFVAGDHLRCVLGDIVAGLCHLHENHVIHRDGRCISFSRVAKIGFFFALGSRYMYTIKIR